MKELLITQPDFMETFSCIGSACREHCCKNQNITLDRNRYQKYIKSPYPDVKRIAITQISVTQTNLAAWANIPPDSQGNCPFLDEEQLCHIYKYAGVNALSKRCATYPQVDHIYRKQKIKSMSLSCPEVTRKVLFSVDALTLRFSIINQYDYFKASEIVIEERLANRACAAIVAIQQTTIEENLWAVNRFLQVYQNWGGVEKIKIAEIDDLRNGLVSAMEEGRVARELMVVDPDPVINGTLLDCLWRFMKNPPDIRGVKKLATYANTLLSYSIDGKVEHYQVKSILTGAWSKYALPFLSQHTSILHNYFLYRIHHDQLAMVSGLPATATFSLQVIDYFYLKVLISAHTAKRHQLTENDVINIIYSYHACIESTERSSRQFREEVTAFAMREDFPLLSLLV